VSDGRRRKGRRGQAQGGAPPRGTAPRPRALAIPRIWILVLLTLILAFVAVVRLRLMNTPLERDEGEYAYAGQLILQGVPPYQLAYNMKLPGTYGAYALILALFGQSASAVHLGLLLVNAAAILLVFALGRRLLGGVAGIAAAAGYAVLTLTPSVYGMAAHATHFVVLPALAGAYLLLLAEERNKGWMYVLSGVLLGLAFVMKQHGAVFVLFGLLYLLIARWRRGLALVLRPMALLGAGAVLPFTLTCLILLGAGVFQQFWFWTFSYAREYVSEAPLASAWSTFATEFAAVAAPTKLLWLLGAFGAAAVVRDKKRRAQARFIGPFLLCSALGVCVGFYFRPHYFILVLPAVAILIGAVVGAAGEYLATKRVPAAVGYGLPALLLAIAIAPTLVAEARPFFQLSPDEYSRATYGHNPFLEAREIGRYLTEHAAPDARIAVIGSEPEIYFYSRRKSATGFIYTYALMEEQPFARQMQEQMIAEIEKTKPGYLVFVNVPTSWVPREHSERLLVTWYQRYAAEHYDLVGVVDILPDESVYRWGAEAPTYTLRSPANVYVLKRKAA
jgi:hypothetical protein